MYIPKQGGAHHRNGGFGNISSNKIVPETRGFSFALPDAEKINVEVRPRVILSDVLPGRTNFHVDMTAFLTLFCRFT